MKRLITLFAVAVLIGSAAYATGSDEPEQTESNPDIVFFFGGANRAEILGQVVDIFNEQSSGMQVELMFAEEYRTAVQARVASGNPPDIASHLVGPILQEYVDAGHLLDITDESFLDYIVPSTLDSVTIGGRVYAVPLDSSAWGIFYNRDLFADAGIDSFPTTFSGLEDAVAALQNAGTVPFGLALQAAWTIGQVVSIGGSPALYDDLMADFDGMLSGDFDFDRPGTEVIERTLNLILDNAQPRAADTDLSGQYVAFATEQVAMIPQGNWSILQLRQLNPDIDAGLVALPLTDNPEETRFAAAFANVLNVFDTDAIDGTREFLDFFLDKSGPASIYYENIGIPTAIKGDVTNLDPMNNEFLAAMESGMTVPWMRNILPVGMYQDVEVDVQLYGVTTESERESLAAMFNRILADRTRSGQ